MLASGIEPRSAKADDDPHKSVITRIFKQLTEDSGQRKRALTRAADIIE